MQNLQKLQNPFCVCRWKEEIKWGANISSNVAWELRIPTQDKKSRSMGFYQLVPKGSSLYVVQGGGTGARMVVLLGHFNHHLNHPTDQGPKSYQDIKYLYMRIDIEKIKQKGIITM